MAKRVLGKGLGALLSVSPEYERTGKEKTEEIYSLPIERIKPNLSQPRREMDERALDSLAESIRNHGIVQPLVVRHLEEDENYEIVAGERRWRAALMAGLGEVPVRVIHGTEKEMREISLVENIQREDLSPLEVGKAISELIKNFSLTQEEVASRIGWSRTGVTNKLRLLQLPDGIKNMLSENLLSEGHCRALLALESESVMFTLARTAEERGMSVRQLEEAVKRTKLQTPKVSAAKRVSFEIPRPVEDAVKSLGFSLKVTGNSKRMKVSIDGLSRPQLETFLSFLEERSREVFPGK